MAVWTIYCVVAPRYCTRWQSLFWVEIDIFLPPNPKGSSQPTDISEMHQDLLSYWANLKKSEMNLLQMIATSYPSPILLKLFFLFSFIVLPSLKSLAPESACQPKHPIKFQKFQFTSSIYKASYHTNMWCSIITPCLLNCRINIVAPAPIAAPTYSCPPLGVEVPQME